MVGLAEVRKSGTSLPYFRLTLPAERPHSYPLRAPTENDLFLQCALQMPLGNGSPSDHLTLWQTGAGLSRGCKLIHLG